LILDLGKRTLEKGFRREQPQLPPFPFQGRDRKAKEEDLFMNIPTQLRALATGLATIHTRMASKKEGRSWKTWGAITLCAVLVTALAWPPPEIGDPLHAALEEDQSRAALLELEQEARQAGETVVNSTLEVIASLPGTSSWGDQAWPQEEEQDTEGEVKTTRRLRVCLRNAATGCQRTVTRDPYGDKTTVCPPPRADDGPPYRISGRNIKTQIKNAKPDTFYITPTNFNKLGLIAQASTTRRGTGKAFRCVILWVRKPGESAGGKFTASWWDKGLRGTLVTKLPKKAQGTMKVSLNYIVSGFTSQEGGAPSLNPFFVTRKGSNPTPEKAILSTQGKCGGHELKHEFPIPEGATHFAIEPGFDGKDKGWLMLWNIKMSTEDIPGMEDTQTGLPEGDENPGSDSEAFEEEVVSLTNLERTKKGLPALEDNEDLTRAARYHASDMNKDDYFNHDSYDRVKGTLSFVADTFSRISRFHPSPAAENIARGQESPQEVVAAWMNSPGHRANILKANAKSVGVGYKNGYWVQNFGY
jgi:uncharacterized protein YkwD